MPAQPTATGVGTSRAAALRPAVRQPLKARLSLSAPAGAGKTWTMLQVATVLADGQPFAVIDTEATTEDSASSETYADTFAFEVINWQREWGYDPRDLVATLWDLARRGADMPAVVGIDSASHFWRGAGGTLDIAGSRIQGWKGARPVQDALVEAILQMPFHVIVCTRAKMEYAIEESGGQVKVEKVGMAPIQSDDLEYEMQVCLVMGSNHVIEISKTRANVLAGKSWQPNHEIDFALLYKQWLDKGEVVIRQRDVDALKSVVNALPEGPARSEYREAFKSTFGGTAFLAPDQLDDVWRWVFAAVPVNPHVFVSAVEDGEQYADFCIVCKTRSACRWHRADAPDPIESQAPPSAAEPPAGTETAAEPVALASDDPGVSHEQPAAVDPAETAENGDDHPAEHFGGGDVEHYGHAHHPDSPGPLTDVPRGTTPDEPPTDELAERLAQERQIAEEVKQMTIEAVKQQLAVRRKRVTGSDASLRASLVREISVARLGADPFIAR